MGGGGGCFDDDKYTKVGEAKLHLLNKVKIRGKLTDFSPDPKISQIEHENNIQILMKVIKYRNLMSTKPPPGRMQIRG